MAASRATCAQLRLAIYAHVVACAVCVMASRFYSIQPLLPQTVAAIIGNLLATGLMLACCAQFVCPILVLFFVVTAQISWQDAWRAGIAETLLWWTLMLALLPQLQ